MNRAAKSEEPLLFKCSLLPSRHVLSIAELSMYAKLLSIHKNDRNRYGGGVALYVRENLSYTIRQDLAPARLK